MKGPSPFGTQLRHWRKVRGWSQLDLAAHARTTGRHVSFLETGRSRPGAEMVHRLASALDVPLRARNDLLGAAGLPPSVPERELAAPGLAPVRRVVERLLHNHAPFPAIAHDHLYRIIDANEGARLLMGVTEGTDMIALLLGEGPFRASVVDWPGWAWAMIDRLRREAAWAQDPAVNALFERARRHVEGVPRPVDGPDGNEPVWCPTLERNGQRVKLLTTVARFHNARDITVDEVRVELVYPSDNAGEAVLRAWIAEARAAR